MPRPSIIGDGRRRSDRTRRYRCSGQRRLRPSSRLVGVGWVGAAGLMRAATRGCQSGLDLGFSGHVHRWMRQRIWEV